MAAILDSHSHNYYNSPPSSAWKVSVADGVGLGIAFSVVALRCYTKFRLTKSPGWEDFTSIFALGCFITWATMNWIARFQYGAGRHSWDLPPEYFNGALTMDAVSGYFYVIGVMFAKLSLLVFLYRIFRVDLKFRIAAWALGFVVVVWSTVTLLLAIFSCHPIKANWNVMLYLDPKTHCYPKAYNVLNIHGFCNIVTDFALLVLPIPLVWRLQMNTKKKISVAAVFATGVFICGVAIARQYIIYNTPKDGDNWVASRNKVMMSVEFSTSIVVASLPALAPFFKVYNLMSFFPSSFHSKSRPSAMQNASWPQKLSGPSHDVERGTPNSKHQPHGSWKVPRAWKEAEKRNFDGYEGSNHSAGSETTLQPVLATHRELQHRD